MIMCRLLFPACAIVIALPSIAQADEHVQLSAETSAQAGYSNNPFSQNGGNKDSGFIQVDVRPQAKLSTATSVFTLSGLAEYQRYFQRYQNSENYQVKTDYRGTPNKRIITHLAFSYDSSVIGGFDNFTNSTIDPTLPQAPVTSGTDIGLFGTRDRRRTINAGGDIALVLSPRDTLNASTFYINTRYKNFGSLGNYDGYGSTLGYARQLSEHVQIGVQASAARYNYQGLLGDTDVYSGQATIVATLSERWKFNGALGASFVKSVVRGDSTSLSGNFSLCYTGNRSVACITGRHAVLPTGISGTQNTTNAGGSYRYRVTEHSNIGLSLDYIRNSSSAVNATNGNEYLRTAATYDYQFTQRIRLITSAHYRKIFGGVQNISSDFGGQIGVAISLGDNR